MKCENCGCDCDGSINGRGFCNKPECIDAVIRGVVEPIREGANAAWSEPFAKREKPA